VARLERDSKIDRKQIIVPLNKPFVVTWWSLDYLILPPKYLPDLQRVKPENASFLKNFSDVSRAQIVSEIWLMQTGGQCTLRRWKAV
jgi:hypothetical protein